MGTTESFDLLALLRQGARSLLDIPPEATDEEVRRRCLNRLEERDFRPDDDFDTAVRILCADPSCWTGLPPNAPQFARHVERLVRRELERVALRLRTEPGDDVRPALEAIREATELFPSTELWRTRLLAMSRIPIPRTLGEGSQARILEALVESATTWPGEAGPVRRKYLDRMTPRGCFAPATRMLCRNHPGLRELDPLLLASLEGTRPPLPPRRTRKAVQEPPKKSRLESWSSMGWLLFLVPFVIGMLNRPPKWFQGTPPPPSTPIVFPRLPGSQSLFDNPSSAPGPGRPLFPTGGSGLGNSVYAPRKSPFVPGLAPGEQVLVIPSEGDRVLLFAPDSANMYHVPKRDILDGQSAFSALHDWTTANPADALAWVACANVATILNDRPTANRCYEQATRLGIDLRVKTVNGKEFWIPAVALPADREPLIPPPPPLPTLVEDGAP